MAVDIGISCTSMLGRKNIAGGGTVGAIFLI